MTPATAAHHATDTVPPLSCCNVFFTILYISLEEGKTNKKIRSSVFGKNRVFGVRMFSPGMQRCIPSSPNTLPPKHENTHRLSPYPRRPPAPAHGLYPPHGIYLTQRILRRLRCGNRSRRNRHHPRPSTHGLVTPFREEESKAQSDLRLRWLDRIHHSTADEPRD